MEKLLFITPLIFVLSLSGQNILLTNMSNISQQAVQSQQVFASNVLVNDNSNKPLRSNANPQAFVQRAGNANTNQRQQQRRRVATNPVQTNIVNVPVNNINDDIQLQGNFNQAAENNLGNSFGNENNMIEQIVSVNLPAIQLGSGSLNLGLDINLPKIELKSIKFSSRKTVSSSKHKTIHAKNKLAKLNRRFSGKLSFRKKLKIKVDSCFRW